MPQLNPEILRWARESAGMSLEEAASALPLGGKRQSGIEILSSYESGDVEPVRSVLLKMSKTYRRPLLTFYLPHPPVKADRGEDFRTLPDDRKIEDAAAVDALVRDVHVRQRLVRAVLEESEEAHLLPFVGNLRTDHGVHEAVQRVQSLIGFDLQEFRRKRTVGDAFNYLRTAVERTGVFVMLIGNLGSHHSSLSVQTFRGFALSDDIAPFIVINDQDASSAWAFTLLHEFVHILLGLTGISGGGHELKIEQFCNEVASQILLPANELEAWISSERNNDLLADINQFAATRKVSRSLVAYRMYTSGRLSAATWYQLSRTFQEMWLREKAAQKEKFRAVEGGPSYYTVKRHRVGAALVDLIRRTLAEGTITPTKAGKVLGVKPINVEPLLAPV
jgi:Zn-dependent peptidase ImmA (M78 family)/transcriptional regulator with XRE-family HTH domain